MEPILKDLGVLIRKSTIHYNDTCEQKDVVLTDDFKDRLGKYLRDQRAGGRHGRKSKTEQSVQGHAEGKHGA